MLTLRDVQVRYGDRRAVDGVDLEVGEGEIVAVLGPSGCGKSTLLRAVAGLEPLTGGQVVLDGRPLDGLRPDQRPVGLMFQDHALFPHRDVGDNVGFGPRMQRLPQEQVRARVREALDLVDLAGAERRAVTELSGGEQQRVALARALAVHPRLLMLDEPLGSLDRALRDQLLVQLPDVFARVGCGVLYVTHDQDEALTLADRVAVMRAGRLVQVDRPGVLWNRPVDEFVARFLGLQQIIDVEVRAGEADTALGRLPLPGAPDGPGRLLVLPDALSAGADGTFGDVRDGDMGHGTVDVDATVVRRRFAADRSLLVVAAAGREWEVPAPRDGDHVAGEHIQVRLDPRRLHLFAPAASSG
ncbi:ABC transporter ATP-binding protein [Egicoccus sp. AB-alg6-2]|uniref:ABC transporter ATP-binding protein n=1 Tax=Egicoccus sp. AB-alg6-2 TaxID=3242692 RepID=UPI00359EA126